MKTFCNIVLTVVSLAATMAVLRIDDISNWSLIAVLVVSIVLGVLIDRAFKKETAEQNEQEESKA